MSRAARLTAVLVALLLLTGCWSAREINELGIVLSFGLDRLETGEYIVTAMVGNPANPSTATGETGGGGSGTGAWVLSEKGESIFAAVRNLTDAVPRRLFWSHAETVIISRRLAESGMGDIMDVLRRDIELRRNITPLVTEGEITEILGAKPILEQGLSRMLDGLVKNQGQHSFSIGHDLNRYYRNRSQGRTASLFGMIRMERDPQGGFGLAPEYRIRLGGAAVIWQDKMIGELDDWEARGALWILNELRGGITTFPCPDEPAKGISVQLHPGDANLRAGVNGKGPWGEVELVSEGNIGEVHCKQLTLSPAMLDRLSTAWEGRTLGWAESAVKKAKELGVDIFGFGDTIFRTNPQGWSRIAPRWPDAFRTMPIKIVVDARIRSTHLTEGVSSTHQE